LIVIFLIKIISYNILTNKYIKEWILVYILHFEKMAYVYRTPPPSPNRKLVCPWAPSREVITEQVIHITFPLMYQENRPSTPIKRRPVNKCVPGAPIKKLYDRSLLQSSLHNIRIELYPGLADSLRKRIKKNKLIAIKSSECPGAPVKKRNSTQRYLTSAKKKLFENKKNIFSPYSRIL
jgi:hypothetical protein